MKESNYYMTDTLSKQVPGHVIIFKDFRLEL
jgi:hypothetical protein